MRKALSLFLATLLLISVTAAIAETDLPTLEADPLEDGTVVAFEDYNIQITLPSDWNVLEITDEMDESGIIFSCANPEGTRTFSMAYDEFEEATDIESIAAELADYYDNVQLLIINDMIFVTYDVTEDDVTGIATLGGSGIGFYQFVFYPASDDDYGTLAVQIAASISSIE